MVVLRGDLTWTITCLCSRECECEGASEGEPDEWCGYCESLLGTEELDGLSCVDHFVLQASDRVINAVLMPSTTVREHELKHKIPSIFWALDAGEWGLRIVGPGWDKPFGDVLPIIAETDVDAIRSGGNMVGI